MLLHVHMDILDNINLADVANEFVDRKDSRKQTLRHYIYISISYQMYIKWSCVAFYHSLNIFPQANDSSISTS